MHNHPPAPPEICTNTLLPPWANEYLHDELASDDEDGSKIRETERSGKIKVKEKIRKEQINENPVLTLKIDLDPLCLTNNSVQI